MRSSAVRGSLVAVRLLAPLVVIGLFTAAAAVLYRSFQDHPWDRLGDDLVALGPTAAATALAATVASYLAMTGYDALALRYVEHRLPYRRYAVASFVATAFGNNLGASAVVGAALRARVYSAWQVPGSAIGRIIGFNLVTLALGVGVLAGTGLLHAPGAASAALHLPPTGAPVLGAALLAAVVAYLAWSRAGGAALGRKGWRIDRPSRGLAFAQVLLSTAEWTTMAAALYAVLPTGGRPPFWPFAAAFVLATSAGLLSNVPGGLGVFESTLLVLLGTSVPPAGLAVALVAYRLVYYLLPLLAAAVLLVVLETRRGADAVSRVQGPDVGLPGPGRGIGVLTPSVLALGVAGAGVVLLLRGDLPGDTRVPHLSTFTMSLAGVGALFLARGLHRRLRGAWVLTIGLLLGVVVIGSLHREALLTAAAVLLLALLLPARTAFYRTTSLLADPRGWRWPVTVAGLVGAAVYWHDLSGRGSVADVTFWAASASGETPALTRLAVVLGVAAVVVGGGRILAPRRPNTRTDAVDEFHRAGEIVARWGAATSHLAFTGDKRLHFSDDGGAFLMYQIEGHSWVAMGDPVGDPAQFRDLLWAFVERADRHGSRPVFYSVRLDLADLYRACGLTLVKLGEEAVVPLSAFSLEGKARQGMRWRRNGMIKAGCSVEFVPQHEVAPLLPELRAVSDAWLAEGRTREKRFSLGAFDDEYVCRFPVAVVRQAGQVVAFATLWTSGDGREVQVDIMRRLPGGPKHVMNYLFVECMLWAKAAGIELFSLGMAPLSGLRTDTNAPFWDRIGHLLWTHGEHFYNFKGLRHFKEQFDPEWHTRFVAAPGGPALPTSMLNVATLVGGGLRGIVAR